MHHLGQVQTVVPGLSHGSNQYQQTKHGVVTLQWKLILMVRLVVLLSHKILPYVFTTSFQENQVLFQENSLATSILSLISTPLDILLAQKKKTFKILQLFLKIAPSNF